MKQPHKSMFGMLLAVIGAGLGMASTALAASGGSIIVQSTTSTQNAGFYRHVVPPFTAETGIEVRVVAVGTGQADRTLLLIHIYIH